MNYLTQINAFWDRIGEFDNPSPVSIAVYMALLHLNNASRWKEKIPVQPGEIMALTGIGSVKTYYHHLERLSHMGLLAYQSGKNQFRSTQVVMTCLYKTDAQPKSFSPGPDNRVEQTAKMPGNNLPKHSNSNETKTPALRKNLPKHGNGNETKTTVPGKNLPEHGNGNETKTTVPGKNLPEQGNSDKTATQVLRKKLPEQGNSNETAKQRRGKIYLSMVTATKQQPLQSIDNQGSYKPLKHINIVNNKIKKNKGGLFLELEKKILFGYRKFFLGQTGLPARLSEQDQVALSNIARYLGELKNRDPVEVWKQILDNWSKLSDFYRAKVSLTQIDKNLSSILYQIQQHENNRTVNPGLKKNGTAVASGERSHAKRKEFGF